ncbi:hypothetical protein DF182_11735 [Chitinophaga flava]|uniref:Uncharacterized protein n=1 Tax=Chitinophaga flava TaxID=2259036 RepID=A0A365Y3Q2_9BACT|nr:hypothetical protein DF182_11735 [Chitinophaga flava]
MLPAVTPLFIHYAGFQHGRPDGDSPGQQLHTCFIIIFLGQRVLQGTGLFHMPQKGWNRSPGVPGVMIYFSVWNMVLIEY